MVFFIMLPLFIGMAYLLAYGGCGYHQIENGHRRGGNKWGRIW